MQGFRLVDNGSSRHQLLLMRTLLWLLSLSLCAHAALAQPVPAIPNIKLTGTLEVSIPIPTGGDMDPGKWDNRIRFETCLVGNSFLVHLRVGGFDEVVAYRPRESAVSDSSASSDFPVRCWGKAGQPLQIFRATSALEPNGTVLALVPHWLCRKSLLALSNYPDGTTCTILKQDAKTSTVQIQFPARQIKGFPGRQLWTACLQEDRVLSLSLAWRDDNPGHMLRENPLELLQISCSDFLTTTPGLPRTVDALQRMPPLGRLKFQVEHAELLPAGTAFESLVQEATRELTRVFRHSSHGFSDTPALDNVVCTSLADNSEVSLGGYKKDYLLVYLWASWQEGAGDLLARMKRLSREMRSDPTLAIVGVSLDANPDNARKALLAAGATDRQLLADNSKTVVIEQLPVRTLPSAFLIGPDGAFVKDRFEIEPNLLDPDRQKPLEEIVKTTVRFAREQKRAGGVVAAQLGPTARARS